MRLMSPLIHMCRTPLFWSETGERKVFGPDILQEAEKQVCMVRENSNHRRRELSFDMGDFVYLIVTTTSEMRGLSPKMCKMQWSHHTEEEAT
jgi:hypothetical protein